MAAPYWANAQSRALEEVFIRVGLPYKVVGGTRFYERREIKDALAYLRAIANPDDDVNLRRILNVPRRGHRGPPRSDGQRLRRARARSVRAALESPGGGSWASRPGRLLRSWLFTELLAGLRELAKVAWMRAAGGRVDQHRLSD